MQTNHHLEMSADQIEALIQGQQALHQSNQQLTTHILRLTTLISGNELDKDDKGMIGDVRDLKTDVDKLKDNAKKFYWMLGGAVIVGGFLLQVISKVFFKF